MTKTFNFSAIKSATQNKVFNIGENKIQETKEKISGNTLHPKANIHYIGRIQTNKVKQAVEKYDVIQSVGRIKELKKINSCAKNIKKQQKIFLQINISKTKTQSGFLSKEILEAAQKAKELPFIKNIGIMTIGENSNNKKNIKNNFLETQKIQKKIEKEVDKNCTELSMGMSQDYKIALESGTTFLRLGTVLFKQRK